MVQRDYSVIARYKGTKMMQGLQGRDGQDGGAGAEASEENLNLSNGKGGRFKGNGKAKTHGNSH